MKKFLNKYGVYLLIIFVFVCLSGIYKIKLTADAKEAAQIPEYLKGKTVVTLWMRDDQDIETRKYQIDKFNRENKDNIFIDFKVYGDDYTNMLKISVDSTDKPDIFQYGFSELFMDNNLLPLSDLNIDSSLINDNNLLIYNGVPVGVKVTGNDVKLAWNKDLFKKAGLNPDVPPKNWDEVIQDAKKIKEVCPDVVPFEFPDSSLDELETSVGEVGSNEGTIYPSFWDYKKGAYDFDYAKDILQVFNNMYNENLISKDFDKKDGTSVRTDFYEGKAAMIVSTYEDKDYFLNTIPLNFQIGVDNLPLIDNNVNGTFYYTNSYNALLVNKNIKDKEAVSEVYNYLLGSDTNSEILRTNKSLPLNLNTQNVKSQYDNYNMISNFKNPVYDPTMYINTKPNDSLKLFNSAINGQESIDAVISALNNNYKGYCSIMKSSKGFDFEYYVEK